MAKSKQVNTIALVHENHSEEEVVKIDANGMTFKQLNQILKDLDAKSAGRIELFNVYGQRYIGTGLRNHIQIDVHGTPGNDLGFLMKEQRIRVWGNVQDGCGNTMNGGEIIVYGSAGDVLGYSMRGGKIFVEGDAGYRTGIHMKEYKSMKPIIVIGGKPGDFLGEYMAGGSIVSLGHNSPKPKPKFVGVGMHGGMIYIPYEPRFPGQNVEVTALDPDDDPTLAGLIIDFCTYFDQSPDEFLNKKFYKLTAGSHRPYGRIYSY